MVQDTILRQFEVIEEKIEQLINQVRSLETDKSQLTRKIEYLEQELKHKNDAENQYREERAQIRSRIDELLKKIDEYEA